MRKHTPGPWAVNPINAQVDAFKDGEAIPVCRMLWPTTERSAAETEANAHLIAAAPELLAERDRLREVNAALLAALERVEREWVNPYDGGTFENGELPAMDQARAAIAKAKGGAQ